VPEVWEHNEDISKGPMSQLEGTPTSHSCDLSIQKNNNSGNFSTLSQK
jgi:hypothetical protein